MTLAIEIGVNVWATAVTTRTAKKTTARIEMFLCNWRSVATRPGVADHLGQAHH